MAFTVVSTNTVTEGTNATTEVPVQQVPTKVDDLIIIEVVTADIGGSPPTITIPPGWSEMPQYVGSVQFDDLRVTRIYRRILTDGEVLPSLTMSSAEKICTATMRETDVNWTDGPFGDIPTPLTGAGADIDSPDITTAYAFGRLVSTASWERRTSVKFKTTSDIRHVLLASEATGTGEGQDCSLHIAASYEANSATLREMAKWDNNGTGDYVIGSFEIVTNGNDVPLEIIEEPLGPATDISGYAQGGNDQDFIRAIADSGALLGGATRTDWTFDANTDVNTGTGEITFSSAVPDASVVVRIVEGAGTLPSALTDGEFYFVRPTGTNTAVLRGPLDSNINNAGEHWNNLSDLAIPSAGSGTCTIQEVRAYNSNQGDSLYRPDIGDVSLIDAFSGSYRGDSGYGQNYTGMSRTFTTPRDCTGEVWSFTELSAATNGNAVTLIVAIDDDGDRVEWTVQDLSTRIDVGNSMRIEWGNPDIVAIGREIGTYDYTKLKHFVVFATGGPLASQSRPRNPFALLTDPRPLRVVRFVSGSSISKKNWADVLDLLSRFTSMPNLSPSPIPYILGQGVQLGNGVAGKDIFFDDSEKSISFFPVGVLVDQKFINLSTADRVITDVSAGSDVRAAGTQFGSGNTYEFAVDAPAGALIDLDGNQFVSATLTLDADHPITGGSVTGGEGITDNGAALRGLSIKVTDQLGADNAMINVSPTTDIAELDFSINDDVIAGHALSYSTPGTYPLTGITYSGFGPDESATAAIYNNSGGVVTLESNGAVPTIRNSPGSSTVVTVPSAGLNVSVSEPNSQVVVYDAGTTTVLDFDTNVTGTYNYVGTGIVDYAVMKKGFEPQRITGVVLTGVVNQSITLREDIEYQTPSGNVTLATYGINWSINAGTERIIVDQPSTGRNAYSAFMDAFIDSATGLGVNNGLMNIDFPIQPEGPQRYTFLGNWEFSSSSLPNLSRAGFEYSSGEFYSGITDRTGTDFAEAWAYQQANLGTVTSGTGRLDRVARTDNAQNYLIVKRLANGFFVTRNDVVATFGNLQPQQYDFTLGAEALAAGTGTAAGITIEVGSFIVGGENFSYRITSDLSGDDLISNLSAYREANPSFWFRFPQMVFPAGSDYNTLRGFDEDTATELGLYVRTTGGSDHPDFVSFQADNGNVYTPPQQTSVTIELNAGVSSVLVVDDSDTTVLFSDTETGTFNFTIPSTATGNWSFVTKTKGYPQAIFVKAVDGVPALFNAATVPDTQPDGTIMYQATTSPLVDVMATNDGSRLNIDIGNGSVSPQEAYDETEDELATQDGLEYLYFGGGRVSLAVLPGGNYFFMENATRLRRRVATDFDATLGAFAITSDTNIVDGVNGGVNFLSTTDADKISLYQGSVWIDTGSIYSGTDAPIGTNFRPVNNIPDALIIAERFGLVEFKFKSNATISQDISGKIITSAAGLITLVFTAGNNCDRCLFKNVSLTGEANMTDATSGQFVFVANLSGFSGSWSQARFAGTTALSSSATFVDLEYCSSAVAGQNRPVFDLASLSQDCGLSCRNWNGGIEILNSTRAGNNISLNLVGSIELDNTNTEGTCVIEGLGRGINNSSAMSVNSDGYNILNQELENSESVLESLRLLRAVAASFATVPSGAGSFAFNDAANTKPRISGTVDSSGNRIITGVDVT